MASGRPHTKSSLTQASSDLQPVGVGGLDFGRSKGHRRKPLDIEEGMTAEVVVAPLNTRVHTGRVSRYFNGAVLEVCCVIAGCAVEFFEPAANGRDSQVPNRELCGCVGWIQLPRA
jgi:hypothetical protein